jgi:hypothetical protein
VKLVGTVVVVATVVVVDVVVDEVVVVVVPDGPESLSHPARVMATMSDTNV